MQRFGVPDTDAHQLEQRFLERLLAEHQGNVSRAAAASGIARRHLQRLRAKSG
ncbi:MAG: hypothetical protein JNL21_15410 [Myxococcales bacterium]|nr:hypothetical protein [Myxococcales bacterium]